MIVLMHQLIIKHYEEKNRRTEDDTKNFDGFEQLQVHQLLEEKSKLKGDTCLVLSKRNAHCVLY